MSEVESGVYKIFHVNGDLYLARYRKPDFDEKLATYRLVLVWTEEYIDLKIIRAIERAFRGMDDALIIIPTALSNPMLQISKELKLDLPSLEVCPELAA
jgi:hypothetical protein